MADPSVLGNVIVFFQRIGIYDVVLPFLLTFTIVFAIFEKSKILGMEKTKDGEYTKKNLNSMAAFVIAFMVIASSRLVETITSISANIVVLLLLGTFFLLLVGTFYAPKGNEPIALEGGWKTTFTVIMFIGIVVVFLDAIKTEAGVSWLDQLFNYLGQFWTSTAVAAIILIIFLVVFVAVMVREPASGGESKK